MLRDKICICNICKNAVEPLVFLLYHIYLHFHPLAVSAPLGSNVGGAAPVDKWAPGKVVVVEICDLFILWRGESDS